MAALRLAPSMIEQTQTYSSTASNVPECPTPSPIFSGAFPLVESPAETAGSGNTAGVSIDMTEEMSPPPAWNIFVPSESEHAEMRGKMSPAMLERFFRQVYDNSHCENQ